MSDELERYVATGGLTTLTTGRIAEPRLTVGGADGPPITLMPPAPPQTITFLDSTNAPRLIVNIDTLDVEIAGDWPLDRAARLFWDAVLVAGGRPARFGE